MKKVRLHYFSGTGNTARAASRLSEVLRSGGLTVETVFVSKGMRPSAGDCDMQIFLFPVYAFTVPGSMKIYLRHLPKAAPGTAAAVIANHGMLNMKGGWNTGYESQSLDEAANAVRRKGYKVVYMGTAGYPENLTPVAPPPDRKVIDEIVLSADKKMEGIARDILDGKRVIKKYFFLDKWFGVFFGFIFTYIGKWHVGKMYAADGDCNGCGLCVRYCPARAIRLFRKRPRWSFRCDACLGCFNFCPETAIQISLFRLLLMAVVTVALIPPVVEWDNRIIGQIAQMIWPSPAAGWISTGIFRVIFGITLYSGAYLVMIYTADKLAFLLEHLPFLKKITGWTYTKKRKRYLVPGFNPFKNRNA